MMTDKISIFYTSDGKEWAVYLKEKLCCKDRFINSELVNLLDKNIAFNSKVNVFLVSPDFLDLQSWGLLNKFNRKTAVAVLTGVEHNDWIEAVSKHNVDSVIEWLDYELEATDKSVRELLVSIIGIYELTEEFGDDDEVQWDHYINVPNLEKKQNLEESHYKVLPCQSRPLNAVSNVFRKDDDVFLILERMPEGSIEVTFHEDGRSLNPAFEGNFGLYSFPWKGKELETFDVLLDNVEIGYGQIEAIQQKQSSNRQSNYDLPPPARHSAFSTASSISPKSASYYNEDNDDFYDYPPPRRHDVSSYSTASTHSSVTSSIVSSDSELSPRLFKNTVEANDKKHSSPQASVKTQSKLEQIRELLEDETDPLSVLCSCLNIPNNTKDLDAKLTSMIKPTESLKQASFPPVTFGSIEESDAHWPTLVHFGAQFNLFNFCDSLLSSPLMYSACRTRNSDGNLPHDVARKAGNKDLAEALEAFASCVSQGRPGSHDSGFSQCMRLSNVCSVHEENLSTPQCSSEDNQYIDMKGQAKFIPPNKHIGKRGKDGPGMSLELGKGCVDRYPSTDAAGEKTPTAILADIFQGTEFNRNSAFDGHGLFHFDCHEEKSDSSSNDSKGTVKDEDESMTEGIVPVKKSPSGSEVSNTKDPRKSGFSLGKLFRKKKDRSQSESALHQEEEALRRKQKTKIFRKNSDKTDSSTSGYSTYSESSSGRVSDLKEDYKEIMKGEKISKKKSKDRWKMLLSNVQRRNSVRIEHVLHDEDIFAPAPLPVKSSDEIF